MSKANKGYRILHLEACDIYQTLDNKEQYPKGYEVKSDRDYSVFFDYSLDLIELEKVKEKLGIKKEEGKRFDFSNDIISVSFDCNYSKYKSIGKDIYIDKDYKGFVHKNQLKDCLYIEDNKLVAVKVEEEVENPNKEVLNEIVYLSKTKKYKIREKKNIIANTLELREKLYQGFMVEGKEYVRYKRSSGSSRVGTCLFILKEYADIMEEWSNLGLDINKPKVARNLVSFEAYKALSLSSIENTVKLNPYNILVVDDYEYEFEEEVVSVSVNGDNTLTSKTEKAKIKNNIWDGEGLLDVSVFEELGYQDKGMLLLRNRFFKSCVFNTNLQKWFEDNGIKDISQLKGKTKAKDIKDIKMVVTKSSIKYLKFAGLDEWRRRVGNLFGIVKFDKPTHHFDGKMVQTSYQLLNTLQLDDEKVKKLLENTIDYLKLIKNDFNILRNQIHADSMNYFDDEVESFYSYKFETISYLLNKNSDFAKTKLYKEFTQELIDSMKKKTKCGKILVRGTNATLFGNGFELLNEIIGKFDHASPTSLIKVGEVSSKFFDEEEILGARNPHITMGNLLVAKNKHYKEIDKYFNLTKEIICVNAIDENIQQRLNGCDYDSDTMLITNDSILLESAKKNYHMFKVPFCNASPIQNDEDEKLYMIDHLIANNFVGQIVNLSQYLNSILWDELNHQTIEDYESIYNKICILSVLSGMEIDKAKRDYGVNARECCDRIKEELGVVSINRPAFLYVVNEIPVPIYVSYYATTMDEIVYQMSNNIIKSEQKETIEFSSLIKEGIKGDKTSCKKKMNEAIYILNDTYNKINEHKAMYKNENANIKVIKDNINFELELCLELLNNKFKNEFTVYLLIDRLFKKDTKHKNLIWLLLYSLIKEGKSSFVNVYKTNLENVCVLEQSHSKDYDYKLYDMYFKKRKKYQKISKI